MVEYQLSEHANYVMNERKIKEEWMQLTIENPNSFFDRRLGKKR